MKHCGTCWLLFVPFLLVTHACLTLWAFPPSPSPPQAFPPLGHAASCQSQLVNLPSSLDPPAQLSSSFIPSLGGLWLPNPPLWFFSQMLIKIKSWASFWVHFKIILSMRWRTPKGILMSPVAAFSSVVRSDLQITMPRGCKQNIFSVSVQHPHLES